MSHPEPHFNHHRHPGYFYPVHLHQRLYGAIFIPLMMVVFIAVLVHGSPVATTGGSVSPLTMIGAVLASMSRLLIAYCCSVVLALPLALLVHRNTWTQRLLLPLFDVLQSIPVLAFFPAVIIFFVRYDYLEGAAVFIVLISMLWSLVFSLAGGLRQIPTDITEAARVFGVRGWQYVRRVLLPAVFPYFVTGSLLAWAGGWNILFVAEVLHTYLPGGTNQSDLFGIGSVLVHASAEGHPATFTAAVLAMVTAIAIMNLVVWQRLLRGSERYRFE